VGLIARHRELDKGVSSFIDPTIVAGGSGTGRIMGDLKYTRVVSGRPSMAGINLLAFPVRSQVGKDIRNGFEAAPGNLLGSWDLNQIEMRFMAHESEDPDLIAAYWAGADIHKETAVRMFGGRIEDVTDEQREVAKRISFGVITGIKGAGLKDQFYLNGITRYSEAECDEFIRVWFEARRSVKDYIDRCRSEARRYGKVRESVGARTRYLQSIQSTSSKISAEAERASHSHKISSGAQSLIKKAMAVLWPWIEELRRADGVWIRWILQVYDELIFEFPEGYEVVLDPIIKEALCETTKLRVPVVAKGKWAKTWGKLK
jgi:DNA polymerase-1